MNVKVSVKSSSVERIKIEYFNDIELWETHNGILELFRIKNKGLSTEYRHKVASILEWNWIKEDE